MRLSSYDTSALYTGEDGSRVLPQESWDVAAHRVCGNLDSPDGYLINFEGVYWLKRQMLQDVTVWAVDMVYRALVCEGEHTIMGAIKEPPESAPAAEKKLFRLSEEALAFTKAWVDRLDYPLKAVVRDLTEAKFMDHKVCESELGTIQMPGRPFANRSFVVPVDYSPKPQMVYRFKVDKSNRILGLVPKDSKDDKDLVPPINILHVAFAQRDRDPRGIGVSQAIWSTVKRNERSFVNQDKASDQTGGGFPVVEEDQVKADADGNPIFYDEMVKVGEQVDADGNVTDIRKPRSVVTAEIMAKASTGKALALMPGQKAKLLQGNGAEIFDAALDRGERDIAKAYLGNPQVVNEARRDSQSASAKAENVAETVRDQDRGILCQAIRNEFKKFLNLNFGDRYDAVVPLYDIVTEESSDTAAILNAMVSEGYRSLPVEIQNHFANKIGAPAVFEEQEDVLPTDEQDEQEIDASDQKQSEEEVKASFAASFPDFDRDFCFTPRSH